MPLFSGPRWSVHVRSFSKTTFFVSPHTLCFSLRRLSIATGLSSHSWQSWYAAFVEATHPEEWLIGKRSRLGSAMGWKSLLRGRRSCV